MRIIELNIFISFFLLFIFLFLLVKSANVFVNSASHIARKLKMSEFVVGATIVALGTTIPELVININASLDGHTNLAVSNVLGSSIANICLIIGVIAVIKNVKISRKAFNFEIPAALLLTSIFIISSIFIGSIGIVFAVISILALVGYNIYRFYKYRDDSPAQQTNGKSIPVLIVKFVLSLALIIVSGNLLVDQAVLISDMFGISESILGLTVIAVGSSLPELTTGVVSVLKGNYELGIGNIMGANMLNLLLILPISAMIRGIDMTPFKFGFIVLLLVSILLYTFTKNGRKKEFTRMEGVIFLTVYFIFILLSTFTLR